MTLETSIRDTFQRARSSAEKEQRRNAILDHSKELLHSVGPEAFTMNMLATKVGVSKGTLYLYFETKEEIFLALYLDAFDQFANAICEQSKPGITDPDFCRVFLAAARADPTLITLATRLTGIIEINISKPSLIRSKRAMRENAQQLNLHMETVLSLSPGDGLRATRALIAHLMGSALVEMSPDVDLSDLPEDVMEMVAATSPEQIFLSGAELLFRGLRQ